MAEKKKMTCPECGNLYTNTWYGRHLVKEHGYRYLDGINAVKVPNWWRPRDSKGHFLPPQEVEE